MSCCTTAPPYQTHHSGPWITIDRHTNDTTLGEHPGATALFTVPPSQDDFSSSQEQQEQGKEQGQGLGLGLGEEERGVVGHKRQRVSISGKEPPPPPPPSGPAASPTAPARQQEEKQEQDDQQQQQEQPQADQGLAHGDQSGLSSPTASSSAFDGYRYFLLLQTGPNSSHNDCLFLGGWEMYVPTHLRPSRNN